MSQDTLYENIRLSILLRQIFNDIEIPYYKALDVICTYIAMDYHVGDMDEEDVRHMFVLINDIKNKVDDLIKETDSSVLE